MLYRFVMVGTLMWMKDQEQQSARRRYAHNLRVNVPDHEKNTFECACVADRMCINYLWLMVLTDQPPHTIDALQGMLSLKAASARHGLLIQGRIYKHAPDPGVR